jgi:flagellin-like protein
MKKLFRNKKAVSPVVATVLMILVTMVGMTLLFAFVNTYSDSYKAGAGSSVLESLTIEDVWLCPDSTSGYNSYNVNVTIYNAGKIDSTISSAYVDGLKLTPKGQSDNMNLNTPIPVGKHVTLSLTWSHTDPDPQKNRWISGQDYVFKISTLRGSNFERTITAP